jgi:two-component system NtrC family sensor kinase
MASSPENQALTDTGGLARRLAGLGHELAGLLRQDAVIDVLINTTRDIFHPAEIVLGLMQDDATRPAVLQTWPEPEVDRRAILAKVAGDMPVTFDDATGHWKLAPLLARRQVRGFLAVRDPVSPLNLIAGDLLAAIAAQGSVAIESAKLVDIHDDGRRSWQEVVDALALAICIVDQSGSIRRANRAFADLVSAPPAVLVGRPWRGFVPVEWAEHLERVLAFPLGQEVELQTGSRSYAVSGVPVGDGDTAGIVLLFQDQTEERRLQEQLLQSAKLSAMGQLIAGVAHELNNPLASVVGFSDFLGEIPDVPAPLREPLAVIREEAERASAIVRNLLNFARKQDHQRGPADIRELLGATMALLRNALMASRVDAHLEVEPGLPPIVLDSNRIQQVFVNLVTNAAQAIASTNQPGTVQLSARRFHEGIAIDVRDDGPGMDAEVARHVFDAFFSTKRDGNGTGLGLPISQGIVREHGGRITLVTEPGEGATFTVYLPFGESPEPAERRIEPVRPLERSLRVLVIDDEPHILHYMRATLEAWGHHVDVAADGAVGRRMTLEDEHDLVICDLRMPRLGGRELFEDISASRPHLARRIFFSTGDTVRGDTLQFLESLNRPWLHKPFGLAELRALLATAARMATGRDSGTFHVIAESS